MTKSQKKEQLKKMIAEFLKTTDKEAMIQLRNDIFKEVSKLPMSSHDRNHTEDEMDMWMYNSNRYIENPKSIPAHTSLIADFDAIIKTVDTSLLAN
jgi:hypothetical protein